MTGKLKKADQKQLAKWMSSGPKQFSLLYSFTRDGSSTPTFHQKCDNQGPTVTIIYNTQGSVYGGYKNQSWDSSSTFHTDMKAFLFSLYFNGIQSFNNFPIKAAGAGNASYCHGSYGPTFGAGHDLHTFTNTLTVSGTTYTLNGNANFGSSYDMKGVPGTQISNNILTVTELEVYSVTDSVLLDDSWRKTPTWNQESAQVLKQEIENYSPPCSVKVKQSRILLIGPVGAGKSSFFNTISSVFRGYVTRQACNGSAEQSITSKYRMYQIRNGSTGQPLNFRLCDTRGLEEKQGIETQELGYLLDGNVPDEYQFNPTTPFSSETPGFKTSPTLNDKIHCVCFVIDSSTIDVLPEKMLEKIKALQMKIHQKGVSQVVLLTKIDKVSSLVNSKLSTVFKSCEVCDLVDNAAQILGIPRGAILPMKNYEKEIDVADDVDLLALVSLRQLLRSSNDFMFNYLDKMEATTNRHDTLE